jgi:hypothetical protein
MKKIVLPSICLSIFILVQNIAQIDSSLLRLQTNDSRKSNMNMDAVYNRPFISFDKFPISLGGYTEVNWQHIGTDGISEGHQFQMRRMTLFIASSISDRIKFLSELEIEEGGKEIGIEFAAVDIEFHPLLNARAGIIMNPIGAFNQNHDGPKWEFTDRPVAATQLLPATWSNAGFGIFGKLYTGNWMLGYETYLSGGFDQSIIENKLNKTFLPAAKDNADRFEEGNILFTGKLAIRNDNIGELGLSYMGGIYNKYQENGLQLDKKRSCHVFAIDFGTTIPKINTAITSEWVYIQLDIPEDYTQQFGNKQHGGFIDIVHPIFKRKLLGWTEAVLNVALRVEYTDWNFNNFKETNENIGEHIWSITPAISFRPTKQTVLRLNYRYQQQTDFLNNPASKTAGWSLGLSSYF